MQKSQIDQYDMLLSVENHFDDNPGLWSANIPISAAKTEFSAKLDVLAMHVATQLENPTGATAVKNTARENLEAFAFKISAAVRGYASQANLQDLYRRADLTKSDLLRYRDAELVGVVNNLVDEAQKVVAQLGNYGVTADDLEELDLANTEFGALMKNPAAAIAKRKAATDKIAELLPPLINFLTERMDNLMVALSAAQPEFVEVYQNVRTIIDTAVNPLSLTITTLEAVTLLPVANAQLEIVGEGITRVSGDRGYNTVQNLVAGKHTLKVTHPNFVTQTLPFTVVTGETTELLVSLVRI